MADLLVPSVNINSALARAIRAKRFLDSAEKVFSKWRAEHEEAEKDLRQAKEMLSQGRAVHGRSYARFDRQTLHWMIDPEKMAKHMQPKMREILQCVFGADLSGEKSVSMLGSQFRALIETKLATRSEEPLRMYRIFRGQFIQRGILRHA